MSAQPHLNPPPTAMLTTHDVEHPHAVGRRVKAGLTLVGAAAVGVFALILTSPVAIADTVGSLIFR
jgi:hypothetical protein